MPLAYYLLGIEAEEYTYTDDLCNMIAVRQRPRGRGGAVGRDGT